SRSPFTGSSAKPGLPLTGENPGFPLSGSGLQTRPSGGLSPAELTSWIFGAFFINGLITLIMSWRYRQPLAFFWTIPGTVLVRPSLQHLSFPEVIGAFY